MRRKSSVPQKRNIPRPRGRLQTKSGVSHCSLYGGLVECPRCPFLVSLLPSKPLPGDPHNLSLTPCNLTANIMMKRMADKLGHLGQSKQPGQYTYPSSTSSSVPSAHSLSLDYYRESISTERTSVSEWSKRGESMDIVETEPEPKIVRVPLRQKGSYRLSDFIIQRTLGTGSFGRVHLGQSKNVLEAPSHADRTTVRSKHNLRFYAMKVLNKDKIVRTKQVEHTNNEQQMLESVEHPFIINLWGTFQDSSNLYMVMDFVPGGELFTLLRRSNVSSEAICRFYY